MPNDNASEQARQRLAAIEADPKHTKPSKDDLVKTKNDRLDDPEHNKGKDHIDDRWHQDADGNWHHPDFE
jgi:hypothetical protein